jgi:hypothetical protein
MRFIKHRNVIFNISILELITYDCLHAIYLRFDDEYKEIALQFEDEESCIEVFEVIEQYLNNRHKLRYSIGFISFFPGKILDLETLMDLSQGTRKKTNTLSN